ncbi:MAG: DUF805 domain-containing protein [Alphaproteobacteria bacterium]|nr:DUF805 domain-containing protein [Alphaproteobacteria bacterium]
MLLKDKDILADQNNIEKNKKAEKPQKPKIDKKNMSSAWGDAFDYYIRGVSEKYLYFHGRATRLEFLGYMTASGILFFVMFALGKYIDMPLLAYYWTLATLVPTVAVSVRRFHDINKKPLAYLMLGALLLASVFFIGWFALLLIVAWGIFIIHTLSQPTVLEESIFGKPNENDEIYEKDNELIINKFKKLSIALWVLVLVVSGACFDTWKKQNATIRFYEDLTQKVETIGLEKQLSPQDIKNIEAQVKEILKSHAGQKISYEDIDKLVQETVSSFKSK